MEEKLKRVTLLDTSNIENLKNMLGKALNDGRTLLIVGACSADYIGRARSELTIGDRILIIKSDRSVLLHRPRSYKPVNWQPSGSIVNISSKEGRLVIKCIRERPRETLIVKFSEIYTAAILNLEDEGVFSLYASEEDMRKAILKNPDIVEEGLKPVSFERPVTSGFIDIEAIDKNGNIVVIEIKRRTADIDTALQLARYVKDLEKIKGVGKVRGIVVAPRATTEFKRLARSLGIEFKPLSPKRCLEILYGTEEKREITLDEFIS
ncbi:endonuclease NucS [archaeon]|nr:MAG: endonuclease NucS [archaeon]RLG66030.1 MAG: endonuclease NucS [archaeon]RLG66533.1 MAG: endonuclease NucS [archaeon]HDM23782.1 DUF91 domain-containing protein [Candidatus Bathyarchaeota archaeon]